MSNPKDNRKADQLSLSAYEELKTKKAKHKPLLDIPGPVSLIFVAPLTFFIILMVGYIFYIRSIAAH